jgi:hypothetical protein
MWQRIEPMTVSDDWSGAIRLALVPAGFLHVVSMGA